MHHDQTFIVKKPSDLDYTGKFRSEGNVSVLVVAHELNQDQPRSWAPESRRVGNRQDSALS